MQVLQNDDVFHVDSGTVNDDADASSGASFTSWMVMSKTTVVVRFLPTATSWAVSSVPG